jgi:chlorobactene glucosyltransferase
MNASEWAFLGLVVLPLIPFSLTLLNLLTWPRGRVARTHTPRLSVLIPARNEERRIERCVRAVCSAGYPVDEVLVYDDQSTDGTLAVLRRLEQELGGLRVIVGGDLPEGKVGKPHGCAQLASAARGEFLLFVDADTELLPGGIDRLLSLATRPKRTPGVVSAVPRQVMETWPERLLMPLMHLAYTSWLPLFMIAGTRDTRFLAANGQLLLVRRDAYERMGGFAAVSREIVDDMAFCRRAKAMGETVEFADGFLMARCRMYDSLPALWRGFSKNLYEGMGERFAILLLVLAIHLGAFVVPYAALGVALSAPELLHGVLLVPALIGVALNVLLRAALAVRFAHPPLGLLLHPAAVLLMSALTVNSYWWSLRGKIEWSGRAYKTRARRMSVSA